MIERAGDDGDQIMPGRDLPQPLAQARQFARLEQFVSASATGKFHKNISSSSGHHAPHEVEVKASAPNFLSN